MATIELTQGQVTTVPDELFDQLNRVKWFAAKRRKGFYAGRRLPVKNGKRPTEQLHNIVWQMFNGPIPEGFTVDHIDWDTLNNQIDNLRLATKSQQQANRRRRNNGSGFIGVSWHKRFKKYQAYTGIDGKEKHLGYFDDPFEAAAVRDNFVKQLHGEFAVTNF